MESIDLEMFKMAVEMGREIRLSPEQAKWVLGRLLTEDRMIKERKIQAKHALITPNCRRIHGHTVAFQKATNEIAGEYFQLVQYEANQEANFHLVLEIER